MKVCDPTSVTEDKDVPLLLKAGGLGSFQHLPFIEDFQGIHLVCVFHFHNTNFTKSSTTNHFKNFKVFFAQP